NVQYYVAAFDQAMWHLAREVGYRRPAAAGTGYGWADVRHVVEYRSELPVGALFRVSSSIRKVGNSALVTFHRMYEGEEHSLSAECEMTSVYFDLAKRASCPLPQTIRDAAAAWISPVSAD